jgi:hypothetical protein
MTGAGGSGPALGVLVSRPLASSLSHCSTLRLTAPLLALQPVEHMNILAKKVINQHLKPNK